LVRVALLSFLAGPTRPAEGSEPKLELKGHKTLIRSIAFSPDGRILASGDNQRKIKLWDVASGKELATLDNGGWSVYSVAFSPDGKTLAAADGGVAFLAYPCDVKLWDVQSMKVRATLHGHSDNVISVAYSPDGKVLVSGSRDRLVRLWDTATGAERSVLRGHTGCVTSVAFSPDGKTIASGSTDETLRLWDIATGKTLATLDETGWVTALAFNPNGKSLVSQGFSALDPSGLTVWDVAERKKVTTLTNAHSPCLSLAFTRDGTRLACGGTDGDVKLCDTATWRQTGVIGRANDLGVVAVAFAPDGKLLASASGNDGYWGELKVWDVTAQAVPGR
jgi:WD40 repeat protein